MLMQRFRNLTAERNSGIEIPTFTSVEAIRRMDQAIQAMNRRRFLTGIEAEHRSLARAIPSGTSFAGMSILPSDNVCYESTDTLTSVYNGSASAAAALGPFLTQGSGTTAYSFQTALKGSSSLQLACAGGAPSA
uniref:Uncharacterized protein n=1 Tax=mine drainage metagenome TaxID=410659 RepID=E6QHQ7_9ZZZZ